MNAPRLPHIAADTAADDGTLVERLMLLGTQMLKLASEMARRDAPTDPAGSSAGTGSGASALLGILAEGVYRDRRRRDRHLPSRLLGEPAWDILLDLYVAACQGQEVSVSNACLAADAPASTALRWVKHLEAEGLVARVADHTDARRHYVRLTDHGLGRMSAYFADCRADLVDDKAFGHE